MSVCHFHAFVSVMNKKVPHYCGTLYLFVFFLFKIKTSKSRSYCRSKSKNRNM